MLGFGKKKDDEDEKEKAAQEQVSQAMRSMSDQIGAQARQIQELQKQLEVARKDDAESDAAEKALREAQAKMSAMQVELDRAKAAAQAATAQAAAASKAAPAAPPSAPAGSIGGGTSAKITPHAEAPATGGLRIGGTAYVQKAGGKNLRLRSRPGLESDVIDGLAPGTSMTLLGGPQNDDGYPWWHVRTSDGREGWVAGTELVTNQE